MSRKFKFGSKPGVWLTKGLPPCKCQFCDHVITEARLYKQLHGGFGPGMHIYEAHCPHCDVDYTIRPMTQRLSAWALPEIDPSSLLHQITADELDVLNRKFEPYKALGPKWKAFLARLRQGDELWRFRSSADDHTAIAVLRSGRSIRIFSTFGNL